MYATVRLPFMRTRGRSAIRRPFLLVLLLLLWLMSIPYDLGAATIIFGPLVGACALRSPSIMRSALVVGLLCAVFSGTHCVAQGLPYLEGSLYPPFTINGEPTWLMILKGALAGLVAGSLAGALLGLARELWRVTAGAESRLAAAFDRRTLAQLRLFTPLADATDRIRRLLFWLRRPKFSLRTMIFGWAGVCAALALSLTWYESRRPDRIVRQLEELGIEVRETNSVTTIGILVAKLPANQHNRVRELIRELHRDSISLGLPLVPTGTLSEWLGIGNITELWVLNSQLNENDLESIGAVPGLRSLALYKCTGPVNPPPEGFASASLEKLRIIQSSIGGRGWYLHGSGTPRLQRIWMDSTSIDQGWCQRLEDCPQLFGVVLDKVTTDDSLPTRWFAQARLRGLRISDTALSGPVRELDPSARLNSLTLYNTDLKDEDQVGISRLKSLTNLGLGKNDLTGVPWVDELAELKHLVTVDLQGTLVRDDVAWTLFGWNLITWQEVVNTPVSEELQQAMRHREQEPIDDVNP